MASLEDAQRAVEEVTEVGGPLHAQPRHMPTSHATLGTLSLEPIVESSTRAAVCPSQCPCGTHCSLWHCMLCPSGSLGLQEWVRCHAPPAPLPMHSTPCAPTAVQACGCRVGLSIPSHTDLAERDAAIEKGPVLLQRGGAHLAPAASPAGTAGGAPAQPGRESMDQEPSEWAEQQQAQQADGEAPADEVMVVPPPAPPEGTMARMLRLVREQGESKQAVVARMLGTLLAIPGRPRLAFPPGQPYVPHGQQPDEEMPQAEAEPTVQQQSAALLAALLPAQQQQPPAAAAAGAAGAAAAPYLEDLPRCKALMEKFRASKATASKTALQAIHEYAARLMLEVGGAGCWGRGVWVGGLGGMVGGWATAGLAADPCSAWPPYRAYSSSHSLCVL